MMIEQINFPNILNDLFEIKADMLHYAKNDRPTASGQGSQGLIIITSLVMNGIFRVLYLVYTQNKGGDPTKLKVKGIPAIVNAMIWVLTVGFLIFRFIPL
jgi:hypothetical protein